MNECVYIYTHIYTVCVYIYIYIYKYIYIYMYIHTHDISIHIYIYREREREILIAPCLTYACAGANARRLRADTNISRADSLRRVLRPTLGTPVTMGPVVLVGDSLGQLLQSLAPKTAQRKEDPCGPPSESNGSCRAHR